jgi:hypothetical protein
MRVFSTGFEPGEGYDQNRTLIGQLGWVGSAPAGCLGNGLLDAPPNQWAFIGFVSVCEEDGGLNLWQPLNYSPLGAGKPIVTFRVVMAVVDSQNGFYDCFRWSVYSTNRQRLFTLDFDNVDLTVNYQLEGGAQFMPTGREFRNGEAMELEVEMDFARNRWRAALDGTPLIADQPVTRGTAPLHLDHIDAVWVHGTLFAPGDNYMVFDDYSVTARAAPVKPRLTPLGFAGGRFLLRVEGDSGADYAIEASTTLADWTAIATNRATAGSFLFLDESAPARQRRFYRAFLVP